MRLDPTNTGIPFWTSSQPPSHTCTILGWTFTRPLGAHFTPTDYPGYWSLHLAEVSRLVYGRKTLAASEQHRYSNDEAMVRDLLKKDCANICWFDRGTTQAVGYVHENHACLVFRGSQESIDFAVDLLFFLWNSPGRHLGFHLAWKRIEGEVLGWLDTLPPNDGLITAGHSLGGALAVVSSFELSGRPSCPPIRAVNTFGCPRVGAIGFYREYARRLNAVTRCFKHDADAVTIIPPMPLFLPVGTTHRISSPMQFHDPLAAARARSAALLPKQPSSFHAGFLAGLKKISSVLAPLFNYAEIPEIYLKKEPILGLLIALLTSLFLFGEAQRFLLAHLPLVFTRMAHNRFGAVVLIVTAMVIVEQLTYLIPLRAHWLLRFAFAALVVASVEMLHFKLLWIAPTIVWTCIIAIFLVRALLPSGTDHFMLGYLRALSCPPGLSGVIDAPERKAHLHRILGLR